VDERVAGFIVVATLLTITPGPDMALVTRNVLRAGPRAGLRTSAGILAGLSVWAILAAVGVAAVLAASATAFTALKLVGAVYLVYLGVMALWEARRGSRIEPVHGAAEVASSVQHYRQGLLSNLTNPKVGIFYTTFLPQFIAPGHSVLVWTTVLAALHLVISVFWLVGFSFLVAGARRVIDTERTRLWLQRVTGTVLIALGVRVARQAT
jgi:RhtB (resistance to homoserine/threonine) family protein